MVDQLTEGHGNGTRAVVRLISPRPFDCPDSLTDYLSGPASMLKKRRCGKQGTLPS